MITKKMIMNRRSFIKTCAAGAGGFLLSSKRIDLWRGKKPNIIVIVSDDMGYADLGCYGGTDIPTPNIDSLAADGVRFTDGYVSCPVCSPTRAGLLTGRYQQRFGHERNVPFPPNEYEPDWGLPLTEITIADILRSAGYVTGAVGKWHLGMDEIYHPQRRGFDEFFGFMHGAHSYEDAQADPLNPILRNYELIDEPEYLTDAFGREAADFIEHHADEAFFLYLPFNAVHGPLQAPPRYADTFNYITDPKRQTYAGMLAAMDDAVGTLLDKLEEHDLTRDTLIFFVNDNGGPTQSNGSDNTPLRGIKAQMWEGGIRVAFIVKWPAKIPAGTTFDKMAISLDILPTVAAAANASLAMDRTIDGVDLLPYLTGQKSGTPHEILFWRKTDDYAMRKGNWKLTHQTNVSELYDLDNDIGEQNDLALTQPGKLAELENIWAQWNSKMMDPLW